MNRPDRRRIAAGVDLALAVFWIAFFAAVVLAPDLITLLLR